MASLINQSISVMAWKMKISKYNGKQKYQHGNLWAPAGTQHQCNIQPPHEKAAGNNQPSAASAYQSIINNNLISMAK